ncbi:hypothetical protein ACPCHT_08340 [Nucisporomicrobium flavum]|uniref:hypothetical protein n=1 Tax=Nucisporomicrobium flavum TaxID=2785915 RepID=UPI0018F7767E|nr:hypothetical protein [Nucisporomicrobium flavum]
MRTNPLRRRLLQFAVAAAAVPAALLPLTASPAAATTGAAAAPTFTKIEGAAGDAAGLQPTVDAYRALLGEPNNGSTPGSQPAGRREINWDGTPDAQSAPNALPRDFFNTTVPRGAVFSSGAGNRFQVSADSDNPTWTPVRFGNLNSQYPGIFATFSPQRLFTPIGTNQMSVRFFSPGTTTPATVKGFGAVFTDVDKADTTKIELYDRWGARLWWHAVPKGTTASKSLSFLGVKTSADVYEVRITTGNAPLSATNTDTSTRDVVVMDDLLYGEPHPLS